MNFSKSTRNSLTIKKSGFPAALFILGYNPRIQEHFSIFLESAFAANELNLESFIRYARREFPELPLGTSVIDTPFFLRPLIEKKLTKLVALLDNQFCRLAVVC